MGKIKFRQPRYHEGKFRYWHYWGFVDGIGGPSFVSPIFHTQGPTREEAEESSQQFADLTDKDGKPLNWWEGDILGIKDEALYEIVKEDGCFWAKLISSPERVFLYSLITDNVTVVGNIYENPELLKVQKNESMGDKK